MIAMSLQTTVCLHCGSAVDSRSNDGASGDFCCTGCESVYGLLQSAGLSNFYLLRDANPPACVTPANYFESDFRYFDDSEFIKTTSAGGLRVRFFLEGMNCTACIWLLEKLPDFCNDARSARVDIAASTIEVERTPNGSFAAIATTLNRLGYRPHPLREDQTSAGLQRSERRADLIRIGAAAALTGNIMILTVSLYGGADGELQRQFQWLTAMLASPVLTYCAWPFYRSALSALRQRRLNLDVPIVVAILAGVFTSAVALWKKTDSMYFDSLSMLVFLLLSSRFFLKSIQNRNLQATNIEDDLLIGTVQLIGVDGLRDVSVSSLNPDDRILLAPGRLVPVDGVIESGFGTASAAILTGESAHLHLATGSPVEAGYRFLSGDCILRVHNSTRKTKLAAILHETEKLAASKSHFLHVADVAAQYFIASVFVSACFVVGYFFSIGEAAEGISRALALVIVTCPCVFGIAIPLSMAIAIRRAARRGIIVKSGDAIEKLWKADHFYFDKTATLTTGNMEIVRASYASLDDVKVMHGLEQNQLHPVGHALTSYARNIRADAVAVQNVIPLRAGGVTGTFEGARYTLSPTIESAPEAETANLISNFELRKNDVHVAEFVLSDEPRDDAVGVLRKLRSHGWKTLLLSGDRARNVEDCAQKLEFLPTETFAQMTAERKADMLKSGTGTSVMIGDGANDAAAFAAADVGIAVCGSLDVSLRAADVYLTRPKLNAILDLIEISRSTKVAIFRNLAFSASFNVFAGSLAVLGHMTPLWAAVIMPISSVTVLLSAAWSKQT